jgi:hypothetical protein
MRLGMNVNTFLWKIFCKSVGLKSKKKKIKTLGNERKLFKMESKLK